MQSSGIRDKRKHVVSWEGGVQQCYHCDLGTVAHWHCVIALLSDIRYINLTVTFHIRFHGFLLKQSKNVPHRIACATLDSCFKVHPQRHPLCACVVI